MHTPTIDVAALYAMEQRFVASNKNVAGWTQEEIGDYMRALSDALGIDNKFAPFLVYPAGFDKATGKDKLTIYASRSCADQLAARHRLSQQITRREYNADMCIYLVEARVTFPDGRMVERSGTKFMGATAKGSFPTGENAANFLLTAETKAFRRATLAACNCSFLDETEVDTLIKIPEAIQPRPISIVSAAPPAPPPAQLASAEDLAAIKANAAAIDSNRLSDKSAKNLAHVVTSIEKGNIKTDLDAKSALAFLAKAKAEAEAEPVLATVVEPSPVSAKEAMFPPPNSPAVLGYTPK
jgi:hypothetical protein